MKKMTFLLSLILLSSVSLIAKDKPKEVTDSELARFAEVFQEVQGISKQSQDKMVKAIEDEGLELQRYNAIGKAQRSGDKDIEVTEEEIEKLHAINSKLVKINSETSEIIEKKLGANNLTSERYQEILQSVQKDEKLKIKLRDKLQEKLQKEAQEKSEEDSQEESEEYKEKQKKSALHNGCCFLSLLSLVSKQLVPSVLLGSSTWFTL